MSTTACAFVPIDEPPDERGWRRWRCSICGRKTNPTPHGPNMIHATCAGKGWRSWRAWRFGDVVAATLAMVGVTEETIKAMGFERCNCAGRRQRLNAFGMRVRRWLIDKIDRPRRLLQK